MMVCSSAPVSLTLFSVHRYLVDLHDGNAVFDFCGGMMFQLVLSDKLHVRAKPWHSPFARNTASTGIDRSIANDGG